MSVIALLLAADLVAQGPRGGGDAAAAAGPPQITQQRPSADVSQIGPSTRDVSGPPPVSTTAQSRDLTARPLEGADRCDPAASSSQPEVCGHPIEQRAGEFAPGGAPAPLPSAETRLLAAQGDAVGADAAARQLAQGQVQGSAAAQAIAAGVVRTTPELSAAQQAASGQLGANAASPNVDAATAAVINAAVGTGLVGSPTVVGPGR